MNGALGGLAWITALIFFFPVLWMVLNSFKTEAEANAEPQPRFDPTLDRYREVTESVGGLLSFGGAFMNSVVVVLLSTLIVLALAIPAAYALAIKPVVKWRDVLSSSSRPVPAGRGLHPAAMDTRAGPRAVNTRLVLIILYTAINLPLAIWMLRSFFAEIRAS